MRVLDALATVAGRISTGVAMAVAITVGLWPDHPRDIDPVRLGAVVTTIIAWLAAEIVSGRKPSDHDIALFKRVVELLPADTIDFLRNHDFSNSFAGNRQQGLSELAAWEGARFQFIDKALEKRWAKLLQHIRSFNAALVASTGPVGAGPLFSVHPDHGDRDNPKPWVVEHIKKLNSSATKLSQEADAFETFARNRLRL